MTVDRWMGWLTLLLAGTASEDKPAASADDVQGCKGLPGRDRVAKDEAIGDDALQVVARSGERSMITVDAHAGCRR